MDELLNDEQAQVEPPFLTATVSAVTEEGLKLQLHGQETGEKIYHCNPAINFSPLDNVLLASIDDTYVVVCPYGYPYKKFPLPQGGTAGQLLAKKNSTDYELQWINNPIPSGGTKGQVLTKRSDTSYSCYWADASIPAGGSDGQVLVKNGSADYNLKWADLNAENKVPSGGSAGQVLTKRSASDYDLYWSTPSGGSSGGSSLSSGSYSTTLTSTGTLQPSPSNMVDLGSSTYPFADLYANGTVVLGNSYSSRLTLGGSGAKIGFFGKTPIARQSCSSSATLATLITYLKNYGLFS